MARKRHLRIGSSGRSACGLDSPALLTRDPREVTCEGCKRTLYMADAEVESRQRRK